MDIIPVFETVVPGSNPGGCTRMRYLYSITKPYLRTISVDKGGDYVYKGQKYFFLI